MSFDREYEREKEREEQAKHGGKVTLSLTAIVFIALGVVLLKYPGDVMEIICKAFGIVTLVFGVLRLVTYLRKRNGGFESIMDLTVGVIMTAVGVFLLLSPDTVISIIPFLVGLILFFHSITKVQQALELRDVQYPRWWLMLIFALAMLGMAFYVAFNPFATAELMVKVIGIILIVDGALSLVGTVYTGAAVHFTRVARIKREKQERRESRERRHRGEAARGADGERIETEVIEPDERRIR